MSTQTSSPLKGPFLATLEASISGLRVLAQTLQEEQAALTGNDPQRLEDCVQRKIQQLQQLEHSVLAREQILKQTDCGNGLAGTEQFLRRHFQPQEILAQWQELQSLSQQVDELNISNGKLAMAGERSTRHALSILTGRSEEPQTYGRKAGKGAAAGYSLGKC